MKRITLDPSLRSQFDGVSEELEVCDASGRSLGHFLPNGLYAKLLYAAVKAACPFSAEELARRRQEREGKPLAEILQRLRAQ